MESEEMPAIHRLPREILEDIFFRLRPFGDLQAAALVCKLWRDIARSVMARRQRFFERILRHFPCASMAWRRVLCAGWNRPSAPLYNMPAPAPRYLAAIACQGDCVYFFGGLTPQFSLFNDFWRFHLTTERWERIACDGDFPSLRAAANFVPYGRDRLILFGGFECQGNVLMQPYPMAVPVLKMHLFTISRNTWSGLSLTAGPKEHRLVSTLLSYSLVLLCRHYLFLFGGRRTLGELSDECFVVSLESGAINLLPTLGDVRPRARFGHAAVALDERRMLVLGGDQGPNSERSQVGDLWILCGVTDRFEAELFEDLRWQWTRITAREELPGGSAPNRIFADSIFKIPNSDLVLVLGGANPYLGECVEKMHLSICDSDDEDQGGGGCGEATEEAVSAERKPSVRLNARADRQRRLAALERHDPRLRDQPQLPTRFPLQSQRQWYIGPSLAGLEHQLPHLQRARKLRGRKMCIYVLDVGRQAENTDPEFVWLPLSPVVQDVADAPDETHCYMAVLCRQQICLVRGLTVTSSRHRMRFMNFREHLFPQAEGSGCVSRFNDVFIWEMNRKIPYW